MNGQLEEFIRAETGSSYLSGWLTVGQELIDRFADVTCDWNFIHVDPEKAGRTEFGGTIAHGFLLLSLLAPLRAETPRPPVPGLRMGLNYGFERVRFVGPVRAGSRIRARFVVAAFRRAAPGRLREEMDVTLEVEGAERPVLAARWLTMYLL